MLTRQGISEIHALSSFSWAILGTACACLVGDVEVVGHGGGYEDRSIALIVRLLPLQARIGNAGEVAPAEARFGIEPVAPTQPLPQVRQPLPTRKVWCCVWRGIGSRRSSLWQYRTA